MKAHPVKLLAALCAVAGIAVIANILFWVPVVLVAYYLISLL